MKELQAVLNPFPFTKKDQPTTVTSSINQQPVKITRIKTFNIEPINPVGDQNQYEVLTTAVANAPSMSFEVIAHTAEERGDKVTRLEVDAPLRTGWENKESEVIQFQGKIVGWKQTGEQIIINKLPPASEAGNLNIIQNSATSVSSSAVFSPQTVNVVEAIGIASAQHSNLEEPSSNDYELENNQYLNTPANITPIRPQITENPDKQKAA